MSLKEVELIDLPKILDERGNLSFFQNNDQLPFEIKRVYWIYDVPGGDIRGAHAFKTHKELIIALSGSFDVILDDGINQKAYTLNRSYFGLYIPPMTWRHLENFSTNSLALLVSDHSYDKNDYIRDLTQYKQIRNEQ